VAAQSLALTHHRQWLLHGRRWSVEQRRRAASALATVHVVRAVAPKRGFDRYTFLHAGHSYHVRFCVIGAHVALIVVFRVESRESMTNDIVTSTSGVAPSDIELTGSASPDPAPAWPSCLALDDEGKNPLSRSRSQKSDSVKQTRRLGFSVHQPGARVA
jgi:hypothetical protein